MPEAQSGVEFNNNFSNENYPLSSVAPRKAMLTTRLSSSSPLPIPILPLLLPSPHIIKFFLSFLPFLPQLLVLLLATPLPLLAPRVLFNASSVIRLSRRAKIQPRIYILIEAPLRRYGDASGPERMSRRGSRAIVRLAAPERMQKLFRRGSATKTRHDRSLPRRIIGPIRRQHAHSIDRHRPSFPPRAPSVFPFR